MKIRLGMLGRNNDSFRHAIRVSFCRQIVDRDCLIGHVRVHPSPQSLICVNLVTAEELSPRYDSVSQGDHVAPVQFLDGVAVDWQYPLIDLESRREHLIGVGPIRVADLAIFDELSKNHFKSFVLQCRPCFCNIPTQCSTLHDQ